MAQRRMFSLKVVDTDMFLDMSPTAQNLYFHLGMRADDDGFVSNPKKIMKIVGAPEDDIRMLVAKGFIIPMSTNGVCVVTHWKVNNLIKSDRYVGTIYKEEKARVSEKDGVYYIDLLDGSKRVPKVEPQDRLGKDRLGKDRLGNSESSRHFVPPSLEDVKKYCLERNNVVDPSTFLDFYTSKGWVVGKTKMKDWQAAVRTWEKRNKFITRKIEKI